MQIAINRNKLTGYRSLDGWTSVPRPALPPNLAKNSQAKFLTLVSGILAEQRKIAWDHEHHLHGGQGEAWQGAALVETADHSFFLQSNAHLPHSFGTRNCAEVNGVTDAFGQKGEKLEIAELYFMGGRADASRGVWMLPGEEGRRYTPCGSCRDVIHQWRRRAGEATKVTMLPLNDGTLPIVPYDGRPIDRLLPNQALTLTIEELLPELDATLPDPNGKIKNTIRQGWGYIRDSGHWTHHLTQEVEQATLDKFKVKPAEEMLRGINQFMMNKLCHLYHNSEKGIRQATIAVARADNGEFFSATASSNSRTTDVHPAVDQVIERMLSFRIHARITDVFLMNFDFQFMPELLSQWQRNPKAPVVLPAFDGNARERVKKAASIDSNLTDIRGGPLQTQDASFHVVVPNDVQSFDTKVHVITRPLRTLLPNSYLNPRMVRMGVAP